MCYGTENGSQTRFFDTIHNATEVWCLDSTQRDREHVLRHYTTTGQRSGVSTLHNRTETMCLDTTPTGQRACASTLHNGTETMCFDTTQQDRDHVLRHYPNRTETICFDSTQQRDRDMVLRDYTTGQRSGDSALYNNGKDTRCFNTTQRGRDHVPRYYTTEHKFRIDL